MKNTSKGIHHISVISGDGQQNANFYVNILGLRMVLKTVNQDDPANYHLFYANGAGQPGSSLTFFPWPMAQQGKSGSGEAALVSFAVPSDSMEFWAEHFGAQDIDFEGPYDRFGKEIIGFKDPDGLHLKLVFDSGVDEIPGWQDSIIPAEFGIRGFWGTTMKLEETEATAEILEKVFGFEEKHTPENAALYQTESHIGGSVILEKVEPKSGKNGRGIIHHVAFRAENKEEQKDMRQQVIEYGLSPTDVIDRDFFFSVYFRSPGGVLFEIATDGPGYQSVQSEDEMGHSLYLPDWLEPRRDMIEKRLPEIKL